MKWFETIVKTTVPVKMNFKKMKLYEDTSCCDGFILPVLLPTPTI